MKFYTGYSESSNTHYTRNFKEISELPEIGDSYDGRKVIEINKQWMDCEQPCDDNFNYDLYEIICEDEDVDTMEYYVCIRKEEEYDEYEEYDEDE